MMKNRKIGRCVVTWLMVALLGIPAVARATSFSFTGEFTQDDDVRLFNFSIGALSTVTLQTNSYATGGFDPILALFNSSGMLMVQNDDRSLPDGLLDAFLEVSGLAAGSYVVSLMQSDNFANGPTLSDGFSRQGEGNFTGGVDFTEGAFTCSLGSFCDFTGDQRTPDWALDILNVDTATQPTPVPEPGTLLLLGSGLLGLGGAALRRHRRK